VIVRPVATEGPVRAITVINGAVIARPSYGIEYSPLGGTIQVILTGSVVIKTTGFSGTRKSLKIWPA